LYRIGYSGDDFHFDNEGPEHTVFLHSFALANRLVTNREYLEFIKDGGYERAEFWLSLGWTAVTERGWRGPLYWEQRDGGWWAMTLSGMRPVRPEEPACHVSYFEADAYARWAGARLPWESEWEVAANDLPLQGNFAESGYWHPMPLRAPASGDPLQQMYGDV